MKDFIEVSLSPDNPTEPYLVFVYEDNVAVYVTQHTTITHVALYCRWCKLPVVSIDPHVRAELRARGISAQPPIVRALGNAVTDPFASPNPVAG